MNSKIITLMIVLSVLYYNNAAAKTINALDVLSFEVNDATQVTVGPYKQGDFQIYTAALVDPEDRLLGEFHIQDFSKQYTNWKEVLVSPTYDLDGYKSAITTLFPNTLISTLTWVSAEKNNINDKQVYTYIFDYTNSKLSITHRFKCYILIQNSYLIRCYAGTPQAEFEKNSKIIDSIIESVRFVQN
ncbi:MAG: hypothetical protein WCI77_07700 [Candidatus Omnitrophota bacterium]